MTRDEIKKRKGRDLNGLLLEAYHQAKRHAAAGKLGTAASGEWIEEFARAGQAVIDEAVDETAAAAHEAFTAAATVKTVPASPPAEAKVLPMPNQPQQRNRA